MNKGLIVVNGPAFIIEQAAGRTVNESERILALNVNALQQ